MASKSDIPRLESLASQHLAQNDLGRAAQVLKKLAEVKPTAEVFAKLGQVHFHLQRYRDAVACLCKAQALGVRDPVLRIQMAHSYSNLREFDKALEVLRLGSEEHPADYNVQLYFGSELFLQGFVEKAARAAESAAALKPGDISSKVLLSRICSTLGDDAKNVPLLLDIANEQLQDQDARMRLYDCLLALHGPSVNEALRDLQSAHPDNVALMLVAFRYKIEREELDEAERILDRCLAQKPNDVAIQEACARLALAKGNVKAAIASFESIWDFAARQFKERGPSAIPNAAQSPRNLALVYMPIEIRSREFAARVLTACFLANKGFSSLLLATHTMTAAIADLPPGIVLHKTMNTLDRQKIEQCLKSGKKHLIAAIDEEALSWTGPDRALAVNVDPHILPLLDLVLLPGQRTLDAYSSVFAPFKDNFRVAGNARLDLLTKKCAAMWSEEMENIRQTRGPFVLVCTNFATVNSSNFSYLSACTNFLRVTNKPKGSGDGQEIVQMGKDAANSESCYMLALSQTLRELAAMMPESTFVLRAHPGESVNYWQKLVAETPNITMSPPGGSLQAWIMAAKAVIYMSGCTTGMEAFLAGAKAVRFEIDSSLAFPAYGVSAHILPSARNAFELKAMLGDVAGYAAAADSAKDLAFVSRHISMTDIPAAERIAEELAQLGRSRMDASVRVANIEGKLLAILSQAQLMRDRAAAYSPLADSKRMPVIENELSEMIESFTKSYDLPQSPIFTRLGPEAVLIKPR